jgi:glycosyltransferase involved in cell wall biosynthesis
VNVVARRLRNFISVSKVTRNCFIDWTGIKKDCGFILPNSVNLTAFQPGPKSRKMLEQYGLTEAVVLMTVGRLDSKERYKGFDEVLELIPRLRKNIPNIKYLIVGDGPDRKRLEEKVRNLNITQEVIFTGYISEKLKADYYRLSDVFVMPSRKEGFGIVFLEAMACGIPVIGSISDGSSEALLDGKLGELVDPKDKKEIERTIYRVLRQHKKSISRVDLETFSKDNFDNRVEKIMHSVLLDKNYSGVII